MKKILFIHHGIGLGGAPISMVNLILSLDRTEFDPFVLLLKDSDLKNFLKEKEIPFTIIDNKFYNKYYQFFLHSAVFKMKWYKGIFVLKGILSWLLSRYYFSKILLKKYNYDIIHLNSSVLSDFLYAAHKNSKTIIHIREPFEQGFFGIRKWVLRNQINKYADHIIAISKDNSKRLGLQQKTTVVYNFTLLSTSINKTNDNDLRGVLYLGGALTEKGFFTMVESLEFLNKGIKVYFAGYYPNGKKGIKKLLSKNKKFNNTLLKLKNSEKAEIIGIVSDISKWLEKSFVMAVPFTASHFPRPVIESFAYKKPAIGTDIAGMDEVIDHNLNGIIIKKNNAKELAEAINFLYTNPEIGKKMGINGFEKANKLFSMQNVKIIVNIYNELLQ